MVVGLPVWKKVICMSSYPLVSHLNDSVSITSKQDQVQKKVVLTTNHFLYNSGLVIWGWSISFMDPVLLLSMKGSYFYTCTISSFSYYKQKKKEASLASARSFGIIWKLGPTVTPGNKFDNINSFELTWLNSELNLQRSKRSWDLLKMKSRPWKQLKSWRIRLLWRQVENKKMRQSVTQPSILFEFELTFSILCSLVKQWTGENGRKTQDHWETTWTEGFARRLFTNKNLTEWLASWLADKTIICYIAESWRKKTNQWKERGIDSTVFCRSNSKKGPRNSKKWGIHSCRGSYSTIWVRNQAIQKWGTIL